MKVIFLDVDGVLNSYARGGACNISKGPVRRLRDVVDATEAEIVVSSSWRLQPFLMNKLKRYLGYKKLKIYSKTEEMSDGTRGDEIRSWLNRNKYVTSFVILDDMDSSQFEGLEHRLVETDPCDGLTTSKAIEAISILSNE